MCGIFGVIGGSNRFENFSKLYELNKVRGDFSLGVVLVKNGDPKIFKHAGKLDNLSEYSDYNADIYLGHTQAPTSTAQMWDYNTSHPFTSNKWILAHNGVLTNYRQYMDITDIPVDSYTMTCMLGRQPSTIPEVSAISTVASMWRGTFACWILHGLSFPSIYIVRSSCTLFYNVERTMFSSVSAPDLGVVEEVPQGVILEVVCNTLISTGKFKSKSPFFIA